MAIWSWQILALRSTSSFGPTLCAALPNTSLRKSYWTKASVAKLLLLHVVRMQSQSVTLMILCLSMFRSREACRLVDARNSNLWNDSWISAILWWWANGNLSENIGRTNSLSKPHGQVSSLSNKIASLVWSTARNIMHWYFNTCLHQYQFILFFLLETQSR